MRSIYRGALILTAALALAGCDKGLDTRLATTDAAAYKASLNKAWADMTIAQRDAFNWAVSDFDLQQLIDKYPKLTPRLVITQEADEYIRTQGERAANATAEIARNADRFAQEEKLLREVEAELAKVTAKGVGIDKDKFFSRSDFAYEVSNGSRFNISSAQWDAWLFLNGEQTTDRHCQVSSYFKHKGGLPAGATKTATVSVGFMDCSNWDTLEVQKASTRHFQLKLINSSVRNFDERNVLPHFSPDRAFYEKRIAEATKQVGIATTHRRSVD